MFYESEKEYKGNFIESFKHKNYFYYKLSALAIDTGSKPWISWLTTATAIGERKFETLKGAGE